MQRLVPFILLLPLFALVGCAGQTYRVDAGPMFARARGEVALASSANNGAMTIRTVAGGTPAGAATSNANSVIVMSPPSAATAASASTVGGQVIPTPPRKQPTQLGPDGNPLPRPHACDLCSKTFVKREHLTKHLRIHKNDNKRYSCEYCQKAFRDRYELVRHTRRHTGDFPFR